MLETLREVSVLQSGGGIRRMAHAMVERNIDMFGQ